MRALWKGAITFGLISIPVRLHSAIQEKTPRFHLLHEEDQGRIKYQRICSRCGKEVSWDDLVRGYEIAKDQYVTFTDDELASLGVESVNAIDVVAFVPLEQIDPIYYNKTYYVAPEPSGLKAYKLLAEALEAEGQVGVAKVAFREKEHLATIRLKDGMFVLETMYWPDEIREPAFEELDRKVDVRDAEVKMARQLVQQLSDDFHPEQFSDEYRTAIEGLVEQKVEGQEIAVAPAPEEEPAKVVDLMEALKASVAQARERKEGAGGKTKTGAKKTTKRRASAS